MEYTEEDLEALNDWEQIQPPYSTTTSQRAAAATNGGGNLVTTHENLFNDCSIFPPSNHEGLPISPQDNQQQQAQPPPQPPPPPVGVGNEELRRWRERLAVLGSGIIRVAYTVRCYMMCKVGFWCIAPATTIVVALVWLCVRPRPRWRRRVQAEDKDRLMLLIREKDQKINQLSLQIAQMNEILSTRRRIPVIRLG
ncbi:hypothetical protein RJ639_040184 [Escallonia herrerae]|uniref:Transmembrane protein n=1 Tax=Escallonia herrerae TaxID=1293975 RepID=A0AA88WGG9_9ASTE|nr:hypothetical protein RJ639_040184 [Escallonia herrerae]